MMTSTDSAVIDSVDSGMAMSVDYFELENHQDLFLKNLNFNTCIYETLVHRITRTPEELRYHLGLISILIRARQTEALQGALVDLFIVVGHKAQALRERLLAQSRKYISDSLYAYLASKLKKGIVKTDCYPQINSSTLGYGFKGTDRLVEKAFSSRRVVRSSLEEARDFINNGQVKQACYVLEKALLDSPGDNEIAMELTEIYLHARDKRSLERIQHALKKQGDSLPECLATLAANFKQGDQL